MSSELPVLHMKIPSSEHGENMGEHVVYINCSECQLSKQKQFVCTSCSPHVLVEKSENSGIEIESEYQLSGHPVYS